MVGRKGWGASGMFAHRSQTLSQDAHRLARPVYVHAAARWGYNNGVYATIEPQGGVLIRLAVTSHPDVPCRRRRREAAAAGSACPARLAIGCAAQRLYARGGRVSGPQGKRRQRVVGRDAGRTRTAAAGWRANRTRGERIASGGAPSPSPSPSPPPPPTVHNTGNTDKICVYTERRACCSTGDEDHAKNKTNRIICVCGV